MVYQGILKNKGKVLENDSDALAYACAMCGIEPSEGWDAVDPEFKSMFLEWFYSGSWIHYPTMAAYKAERTESA